MKLPGDEEMARQLRKPQGENATDVVAFMNKSNRLMYAFTYGKLPLKKNLEILEIGPANGAFIEDLFYLARGIQYTGLDFSEDMVRDARELNSKLVSSGNVNMVHGDSVKQPFPDERFDVVFGVNIVYFWDPLQDHLKEIRRVLKPGGWLALTFRSKRTLGRLPFTKYGFHLYDDEELKKELSRAGFFVASCESLTETIRLRDQEEAELENFCLLAMK
jgi:SAM-dependent methyltransferase